MELKNLCIKARQAARTLAVMQAEEKNNMLKIISDALLAESKSILAANAEDIKLASDKPAYFIDRLSLSEKRIKGMADGLLQLIALKDPIGEVMDSFTTRAGLEIEKVRVPLGVIGIIYEARPNVTADAVGLCLKSGNAVILRGSKDAINSNKQIVSVLKTALSNEGYESEAIQLIEDTSRESAQEMMTASGLIDVLIPRGGAGLIRSVVENSRVPVIETGAGVCHIYVEKTADLDMADNIILNAKLSRPSVCNAAEAMLVDRAIAKTYLPRIITKLSEKGVEIRGCGETSAICPQVKAAIEQDFYTEYNALIMSVKVVSDINEAIDHIEEHSTKHSDAIITKSGLAAEQFLNETDSAAVYVNASTRYTDGFEFGFGAEMGISTQKLHARGPMGLKELTSYKYRVWGNGQVRE